MLYYIMFYFIYILPKRDCSFNSQSHYQIRTINRSDFFFTIILHHPKLPHNNRYLHQVFTYILLNYNFVEFLIVRTERLRQSIYNKDGIY